MNENQRKIKECQLAINLYKSNLGKPNCSNRKLLKEGIRLNENEKMLLILKEQDIKIDETNTRLLILKEREK